MTGGGDRQQVLREQRNGQMHSQNLQQGRAEMPFDASGGLKDQYLEKLTDTTLSQGTITVLDNLLTQDYVLANISDAELDEIKWLSRLTARKVFAMHPAPESVLQGERRAFLLDDPDNKLEPLMQMERIQIQNFIRGIFLRASRARDGWQQEQMSKTYTVSEVRDQNDGDDKLLRGLFS